MPKKQFNVLLEEDLKEEFTETVEHVIGNMNGAKSFAVAQALRDWISKHKAN